MKLGGRDVTEPAEIRIRWMRISYEKSVRCECDQNLLAPAIIVTAIQLSYFCVRL